MKETISIPEAARIAKMSENLIRRWMDSGILPPKSCFRLPGKQSKRRIVTKEFLKFLDEHGVIYEKTYLLGGTVQPPGSRDQGV